MTKPEIPQKAPYEMNLESGDYYWCSCGRSKSQPFCDGSHQGTDFVPVLVSLAAAKQVWLCGCKMSANGAFCDGTHQNL
ncbi:CDGSH iron-sulfur domain-containing protein 3 [Gammaproteobacteria bacterium]